MVPIMYVKDLAYSVEQLCAFLRHMDFVQEIAPNVFCYHDVKIIISPKPHTENATLKIQRSLMELYGCEVKCQEFYKTFLMNYMTMGG